MTDREWVEAAIAAYGDSYVEPQVERVCVVSTRYGGCYEGGRFAAIPLSEVTEFHGAFGCDLSAAAWWDKHQGSVGVGDTPSDALEDWYRKRSS